MKMNSKLRGVTFVMLVLTCLQCKENSRSETNEKSVVNTTQKLRQITKKTTVLVTKKPQDIITPKGMVWIPGGTFNQGAVPSDNMAMWDEKPAHTVSIDGFFIDITEVTNGQFKTFVNTTGYKTVAEQKIEWEEMKKQLPANTPKPHDSIMQPGSLVFKKTKSRVKNLYDFSQWWDWTIGANWQHPNGPKSSIVGKDNEPVVHIAYEDALAYCKWANKRLPTEAEWEWAARGSQNNTVYSWGDNASELNRKTNSWEGEFPVTNTKLDGFESRAPVKSYPPNDFGLYDMAGNVWEWTSDWYNTNYYHSLKSKVEVMRNPSGATKPYNKQNPYAQEKVIKGGSFLCNASYCASYRVSARMATSTDSSAEHLGFRTVATIAMAQNNNDK